MTFCQVYDVRKRSSSQSRNSLWPTNSDKKVLDNRAMNRSKQGAMIRKTIIVVLLVALAFAPSHVAEAQQLKKIPRIGFLGGASGENNLRILRQGLRELGTSRGKTLL